MPFDTTHAPGNPAQGHPAGLRTAPASADAADAPAPGEVLPPTTATPSVLPAVLLIVAAVSLFSLSDALAKLLRASLPAVEVAWLRYLTFAAFAVALAGRNRFAGLRPRRPELQVLRGVALVGSAVLFITGLSFLPVAEATSISFVSPAFITALSIPFLGEKVGVRRWAATGVGLLGVVIVTRPGAGAVQAGALFPLCSALCWAAAVVVTRKMGTSERAETTLLWSAATGLILLTFAVPWDFVPPSAAQLGIGLLLGLVASTGQYLMVLAYRRAAASALAPFSYAQLLSATALGYLLFGAVPDGTAGLGAAVVVASGLYTAHRERVRARERRTGRP